MIQWLMSGPLNEVLGWLCTAFFAVVVVYTTAKPSKRNRLDSYRPTPDNRYPHRDEFKAFMRDVK